MAPSNLPSTDNKERTDIIIALVVVTLFLIGGFVWYDLGQNGLQATTMDMVAEHHDNIEKGTITRKVVVPPFIPTTQQKAQIEHWVKARSKKTNDLKATSNRDIRQKLERASEDTSAHKNLAKRTPTAPNDDSQDKMTTTTRDSGIMAVLEKPFKPSEEERLKQRHQRLDSLAREKNKVTPQKKVIPQIKDTSATKEKASSMSTPPTKQPKKPLSQHRSSASASNSGGRCLIMIGAFENMTNSERLIQKLNQEGFQVYQGSEGGLRTVGVRCPCVGERQAIVLSRIRRDYNREAYFIGKI